VDILTLYVAQGSLAAVRSGQEVLIIDAHMPDCDDVTQEEIEASLEVFIGKRAVRGLILTGLDKDHACPAGVESVLTRYRPSWVMYSTYYKDTGTASEVFRIIEREVKLRADTALPLSRKSVHVTRADARYLNGLSSQFRFELFSPHMGDMDSSNNSSIVIKISGLDTNGFSYLVTGDTEKDRWDTINGYFGNALTADVLAAPHHGARTGVNVKSLELIRPNTVLISAGVDNAYGHPYGSAVKVYQQMASHVYSTHADGGHCLFTRKNGQEFTTTLVTHVKPTNA
jgi:beta-lactamase superfamily II metal-dependent hydrolase